MVPGYRSGLRSSARVRLYRVIGTGYSSAAEREGGNRHQRRRSSGTQNASSRELRRICPIRLAARHFHRDARHAGVAHTFALPCACGWTRHPCLRCFSGARKFQTADGRHGYDPYCPCRNGRVAPYGSHWAFLAMTGTTWLTAMGSMPQAIFEAAFPQHLPKKRSIGAKMRRDAVTSSTLIIVLAPAFRF